MHFNSTKISWFSQNWACVNTESLWFLSEVIHTRLWSWAFSLVNFSWQLANGNRIFFWKTPKHFSFFFFPPFLSVYSHDGQMGCDSLLYEVTHKFQISLGSVILQQDEGWCLCQLSSQATHFLTMGNNCSRASSCPHYFFTPVSKNLI